MFNPKFRDSAEDGVVICHHGAGLDNSAHLCGCAGLEYDLDLFNIVAVSDFNMGAMENKWGSRTPL